MISIHSFCLFSMDEMNFNDPEKSDSTSNAELLQRIILENENDISMEDEEEEKEEVEEEEDSQSRLDEESRKKSERLLQSSLPPGINLFRAKKSPGENSFRYFSMESLSLETDFGYSRRPQLLAHGFSVETVEEIFSDRWEFVRHLFPEAQSVLICDQADFKAVMNFLFYNISVCSDRA